MMMYWAGNAQGVSRTRYKCIAALSVLFHSADPGAKSVDSVQCGVGGADTGITVLLHRVDPGTLSVDSEGGADSGITVQLNGTSAYFSRHIQVGPALF